jgi:hypothetical protein
MTEEVQRVQRASLADMLLVFAETKSRRTVESLVQGCWSDPPRDSTAQHQIDWAELPQLQVDDVETHEDRHLNVWRPG